MKSCRTMRCLVLLIALLLLLPNSSRGADPAGAERQYRVARRLVVEGSPEAKTSLQKVIELDPQGELADDALVDQALLLGVPRWPEELGRLSGRVVIQADKLLSRVTDEFSLADRAPEARYLKALLQLEPLPSYDPADARAELITVATAPDRGEWTRAARYALGWLAEQQVKEPQALEAYQRIAVDAPESQPAGRAMVGLARLHLRRGEPAEAARWLERARRLEFPEKLHRDGWMDRAMRENLGVVTVTGSSAVSWATGSDSVISVAVTPDGGAVIADAKRDLVTRHAANGSALSEWALEELQAVAVGPSGLAYAAAGGHVYALEVARPPRSLASLASYAPVSSMAVDGSGRLWILDRKGASIGKIEPGTIAPIRFVDIERVKLQDLAWDGRRLIALDTRERRVVAIDAIGELRTLVGEELQKPTALAAGPAGRLAVLDDKLDAILLFGPTGMKLGSIPWSAAGVERPMAIELGLDGSIALVDGADERYVRLP